MRTLFVIFLLFAFNSESSSQTKEFIVVKRKMSLGEKTGYKMIISIPYSSKVEKVTKEYLTSLNSEYQSPSKNQEHLYKNLHFNGGPSIIIYNLIEQEGKNIGWTGFFFNEADKSPYTNLDTIKAIMKYINKKVMFLYFEDSIANSASIFKMTSKEMKSKMDEIEKVEKKISKTKEENKKLEKEIESAEFNIKNIDKVKEKMEQGKASSEIKLKLTQTELRKTEVLAKEIEVLRDKEKEYEKSLKKLNKNPQYNNTLIKAQTIDLEQLRKTIEQKDAEYKEIYKTVSAEYKTAEKKYEKVASNEVNAADIFNKNRDLIFKNLKEIDNNKKQIEENEKELETLKTAAPEIENKIKIQKSKIEDLRKIQSQYK